jgi:aminopeptidase N
MLDAFSSSIENRTFSPQDRFNIQTDVYALARAGRMDFVDYLRLLRRAYSTEDNLTVWKSIVRHLIELNSILTCTSNETTKEYFRVFLCELLRHIYERLQWNALPNESSQTAMLRSLILTQMGTNQYEHACAQAQQRFTQLINESNDRLSSTTTTTMIDANIRSAIYLTVARTGNQQTYEQLISVDKRK